MITYTVVLLIWFFIAMFTLRRKHQLRSKLGPVYYVLVMVVLGGLILDLLYQWTVAIVYFMEVTPNLTLSKRLERYRDMPKYKGTWRQKHAKFICENILNKYDPDGHHC
jgi:hypothetical protein